MIKNLSYQQIFALHPQPMWLYERETLRFLDVNNSAVKNYGYSREEFLKMSMLDIQTPREQQRQHHWLAVPSLTPVSERDDLHLHRLKSGKLIEVKISVYEIEHQGQSVCAVVAEPIHPHRHDFLPRHQEHHGAQAGKQPLQHGCRKNALEAGDIGIWERDLVNGKSYYSADWARQMGYEHEDIVNKDWSSRVHPHDLERIKAQGEAYLLGTSERLELTYRLRGGDGSYKWVLSHGRITEYDDTGSPVRLSGTLIDITELMKARHALEASEARLGLANEVERPGLWDQDLGAGLMSWNPRMYELFDIDPGEYSEAEREALISSRIHPDDIKRIRADIDAVLASGDQALRRYRVVHRNGEVRYLEGVSRILRNHQGKAIQVHGLIRDITELMQAQNGLEARNRLLQRLSASVPGIIFELQQSPEGHFSLQYASDSLERLLGLRPEDLRKSAASLFEQIHPADQARVIEIYQEAVITLETGQCRFRITALDGRERWIQCEARSEKQPDGSRLWYGYCSDITQQLRLEASATESEERLRLAADAAGLGIWEHDVTTHQVIWDLRMHEIYGMPAGAFDGSRKSWFELIHPDDVGRVNSQTEQAFAQNLPSLQLEFRIIRSDGQVCYIESLAKAYLSLDGQVQRVVGINRDITHRKLAEQILLEKEAHLRASQTVGGIGSWELDLTRLDQARSLHWSEQCSRIFGISQGPEQISNEFFYSLVHPDDRLAVAEAMAKTLASGDFFSLEHRIIRPDGEEVRVLQRAEIYSELNSGRRLKLIGTVQEVSSRHRLEANLRQSEERLKLAKETAGLGVWEVNLDSGRVIWDARMHEMFDVAPERFTHDMSFWKHLSHPDDYSPLDLYDLSTMGNQVRHSEHRIVLENGETRYLETRMSLLYNTQNQPWRLIGVSRDITTSKRAEHDLAAGRQQLEATLTQMQDLAVRAEIANTTKSEFLNRISHELRTPLNGVIGMSDLLLRAQLDPESHNYANIIHQCGQDLCALIDKILDFSSLTERTYELKQESFSLTSLLRTCALNFGPLAVKAGLELQLMPDPTLPDMLSGHRACLEQALRHLLANGIKFTPSGQVQLRISPVVSASENILRLCFEVIDTGIGITPKQQNMLGEAFELGDASMTRAYGGLGLGLALSRSLIRLLGGELSFESNEHQGSRFWFYLDFAHSEPEPSKDMLSLDITLVSPQEQLREWLADSLRHWGCSVNVQSSLSTIPPHSLLLIDWPATQTSPWGDAEGPNNPDQLCLVLAHAGQQASLDPESAKRVHRWLAKPIEFHALRQLLSTLPARPTRIDSTVIPEKQLSTELRESAKNKPPKVLIVEDNPINQLVLETMLLKQGLFVAKADNGIEALKRMQEIAFDLVLMDCQMPEMDGFEATRQIRANLNGNWNADIAVVAVSAHTLPIDREKCLLAGMNDYLGKPFTSEELTKVLKRWLPQQHQKFLTQNAGLTDRPLSSRE